MAAHPDTVSDNLCPRRLAALSTAVELGVDQDDFAFESEAEQQLWEELQEEFQQLVARIGPVWIAD